MDDPMEERRRNPRREVGMVVYYHSLGKVENLSIAQTKDSSHYGLMLITDKKIEPGESIVVQVHRLKLIAKVLDSKRGKDGSSFDTRIEFLATTDEDKKMVERITNYHLAKGKSKE